MAKILLVCVLLSVVATGYSLKCYNCTTANCNLDDEHNKLDCGKAAVGNSACVKFVYKDKAGVNNVNRKCIVEDPKTKYTCPLPPGAQELFCELCKSDLCNAAPAVNINSFNLLASIASLLLIVKLFL